ncbi:ABC-type molybdate transport system substrate-binding protein [Pseudomonas nitritireducens]|uniref:ABC-type molybdate transport system substrate-binding protein n=1 Tax=Pseudomonas nitroreducens TaxID=46680 RepID=A0A7W7KJZ0_PSENT|nr:substrate-binding domain-containing protein [Pseudomonas nitritireducens]MBB4864212.1 ABC-type molybdate transport system substrate-binding protein [Pseudomonas nitritireducens]
MRRPLLLLALFLLPFASQAGPDVLRVGASHELVPTLKPLVDQYQMETGGKVLMIGGGTDELAEQVRQGTPYDLLLTPLHSSDEQERSLTCRSRTMQKLTLVKGERRALATDFIGFLRKHCADR